MKTISGDKGNEARVMEPKPKEAPSSSEVRETEFEDEMVFTDSVDSKKNVAIDEYKENVEVQGRQLNPYYIKL